MSASHAEVIRAFDSLVVASRPAFSQLVKGGRLRFVGASYESCDLVDDFSNRLLCECISARVPILIVWPDGADWRAPLAFATAVVCDSILHLESDSNHGRVLYVGADSAIKEQFASVKVGATALNGVFAQEFSRGGVKLRKTGPDSTLPIITTIVSPAQPELLIRELHPRWIAVNCGVLAPPPWLTDLLVAAKAHRVPVIGWSQLHLSSVAEQWRSQGGCVLQWPKLNGPASPISSLNDFASKREPTVIAPLVLDGLGPAAVSEQLAQCYLRLARHAGKSHGQVVRDALSVAWRYLRLLEAIPVPFSYYEAECTNYWGMPPIGRLRSTLERFVKALAGQGSLHADLAFALERLASAETILQDDADPPLWIATVNLAIESSGLSQFVFTNRAHRDMFQFALLSKFNISSDDMSELGVSFIALADFARENREVHRGRVTLVGLPSRTADWRFEAILDSNSVRAMVWPHLEPVLRRRATEWDRKLGGSYTGASPLRMQTGEMLGGQETVIVGDALVLDITAMRDAGTVSSTKVIERLWRQPDAAAAIKALFDIQDNDSDASEESAALVSTEPEASASAGDSEWVEEALQVSFDEGTELLLPLDDLVNTIVRTREGVKIEQRYSRALRIGDEILLVHGDHRRGIYDLLVSRVHSHATIAPWLTLIDRWHQELRTAFGAAQRRTGATFESLLNSLRKKGSEITSPAAVRAWVLGLTLAPSDWRDTERLGELLDIGIAKSFAREIGNAASRLAGLHRSLSNRLNRWLESEEAGAAVLAGSHSVVDAELGLTIDDFKHSLVRGRILRLTRKNGPFLRAHLGQLRRTET